MADTLGVKIDVVINDNVIISRVKEALKPAQIKLDSIVLRDSNYYCPMDTSALKKSAITSTVLGSGEITWNTPYARAQYYSLPDKSKQKNPNASLKWFEVAKAKNSKSWEKIVNDEFSKNFK